MLPIRFWKTYRKAEIVTGVIIAAIEAAFQLAGVSTLIMPAIALIFGVWCLPTIEMVAADWPALSRKGYKNIIICFISGGLGCVSLLIFAYLSVRIQEVNTEQQKTQQKNELSKSVPQVSSLLPESKIITPKDVVTRPGRNITATTPSVETSASFSIRPYD